MGLGVFDGAACLGLAGTGFEGAACLCFEGLPLAFGALSGTDSEAAVGSGSGGPGLKSSKARVDAEVCKPHNVVNKRQFCICDTKKMGDGSLGVAGRKQCLCSLVCNAHITRHVGDATSSRPREEPYVWAGNTACAVSRAPST